MTTLLYYIYYTLWFLVSLLPFWLLYRLSDLTYYLLYYLVRYRRKTVRKNLVESFPEKTIGEIIKIEKKFYSFFCDYVFETLKLLSISPNHLRKRMQFEGIDEINEMFKQGKPCGAYLGHYCNWEWISSLPLHTSKDGICGQIYHKLSNKVSDRLFLKLRGRMGAVSIPMKETLRKILTIRASGKPYIIGFISDQSPKAQNIHHWTPFLNHSTPVLTGTERIMKQVGMVAFYAEVSRVKRGYYICKFQKLVDNPKEYPDYEITDMYMKRLEQSILKAPQYWLWTHKRWKWTPERFHSMYEQGEDGRIRPKKQES
ncbi:lysophospholipid acyltransferase family protein [Bacteroides sp. 224]|uniref:lysophospholipid acyltransferase family protein n=1 Tax=Bacteroides sp. 224 TaxID=2302936 RepID=UPI0013D7572D|nr:lysophospholipid acyltransferase family protein [Bacteroides sp. 224]NDV64306.1 acetyltransferase [Bacteroides sp. 224]